VHIDHITGRAPHLGVTGLRLHHCAQTRSDRSLWLLYEIGVPFTLCTHPFDKSLRSPEYLALNPAGRVPTLEWDDQAITESGAIAQILTEAFSPADMGRLVNHPERAAWLSWVHYAETISQHCATLTQQHIVLYDDSMRSPIIMQLEAKRLAKTLDAVEIALDGQEYLLSSGFSAADIGVGQAVDMARRFVGLTAFPNVVRWFGQITARPAYQSCCSNLPSLYQQEFYPPWPLPS
jgi:glutathione S-transferase